MHNFCPDFRAIYSYWSKMRSCALLPDVTTAKSSGKKNVHVLSLESILFQNNIVPNLLNVQPKIYYVMKEDVISLGRYVQTTTQIFITYTHKISFFQI